MDEPQPGARWRRTPLTRLLGLAALFSGAALLMHILGRVSLPLALLAAAVIAGAIVVVAVRRATPVQRSALRRAALAGLVGAVVATVAYDVAKYLLSLVDPSPYNPFEATRIFGILLLGEGAGSAAHHAAGISFHVLNGTAFGVSYCLFFGRFGHTSVRRAVLTGVGWGLFLETFQLTLYPGWLDIRAYREFATISALAHVAYGAVLGLVCRQRLRRLFAAELILARLTGPPGAEPGSAWQ